MLISAMLNHAFSVLYRMSAAEIMSMAPPTHAPWMAHSTGMRARSSEEKVSWSFIAVLRKRSLRRLRWRLESDVLSPIVSFEPKTDRSMPEQ